MDKSKIIISVNSFMPTGFIGWSELAIGLLRKYSCKILAPIDFPEKEKLLKYFDGTDHQLNDDVFTDRFDHTDPEIIFVALEPASEKIIPASFSGKVWGAICGPSSRNWQKQIEVLRERNVTGFLSEVLPEELPSGISNNDLEYFCDRSLFLPPCMENEKASNSPTFETVIVKESDKTTGNTTGSGSKLRRVLPILEQTEGFQTIDFSNDKDFSLFIEDCNKSKAVYNLLHYPQLNLFFKLNRSSLAILNKENPLDSPLRNFLADYSLFEFESKDKSRQPSVRAQTLELLSKNKKETKGIAEEVLSQFGTAALLSRLEHRLGFSDVRDQGDRLDYLHRVTTWESLKKSHVHLKKSQSVLGKDRYVDTFLNPAGSSALQSLFREKTDFSGKVFLNPAFAKKVLSLPNSAATTHLLKGLIEYDSAEWMKACEMALSPSNAIRLAELLYYTCLITKELSSRRELSAIAQNFCDKLLEIDANMRIKAFAFKAKLKLLNPENKLCKEDFPAWENQLQAYAQAVYEVNQNELFLPEFRADAQKFLEQFIELFFQSEKNVEPDCHEWVTLLLTAGRFEKGTKMIRNLVDSGKTPAARVLHYICLCYFTSNDSQKVLSLIGQFEKVLFSMKPFNFWSSTCMLLVHALKRDSKRISETVDELVDMHKKASSEPPVPISWFIILLHLGKALQSEFIEEKALLDANNHFFTFVNSMNFGKVEYMESDDCTCIIEKLTSFIQG